MPSDPLPTLRLSNPSVETPEDRAELQEVAMPSPAASEPGTPDEQNHADAAESSALAGLTPSQAFVKAMPIAFARQHQIMGFDAPDGGLRLAMVDASDIDLIETVARCLNCDPQPLGVSEEELSAAINRGYESSIPGGGVKAVVASIDPSERESVLAELKSLTASDDLLDSGGRSPVIRLVNLMLAEALQSRASDVHVQPYEHKLVGRMRIDGVLYDSFDLPKAVQEEVISRVKVMARMDIAEKRLPQDGRVAVRVGDRAVDLRVSTLPTSFGERVVIRLLDKSRGLMTLDELGMSEARQTAYRRLVNSDHGIALVTGPTGSGKTTTLYAALAEADSTQRNVLTIEDPIEYQLAGVSQTQVNVKKGMTFAGGLRSILRQDPDVIMVGEIRDRETAEIAIQAALTGHLVLSTLHTNDAASAVTRLVDLGIEPFLVASSVKGVLAQRLLRRNCPHCLVAATMSAADRAGLQAMGVNPDTLDTVALRRGEGCEVCRMTGYYGRTAIQELLPVTAPIVKLIQERGDANSVKRTAVDGGMITLHEDAMDQLRSGLTTVQEIVRVAARSGM